MRKDVSINGNGHFLVKYIFIKWRDNMYKFTTEGKSLYMSWLAFGLFGHLFFFFGGPPGRTDGN